MSGGKNSANRESHRSLCDTTAFDPAMMRPGMVILPLCMDALVQNAIMWPSMLGLGFYFGHSLTASFQRFALECIPGRFPSAFRRCMAETRTKPFCCMQFCASLLLVIRLGVYDYALFFEFSIVSANISDSYNQYPECVLGACYILTFFDCFFIESQKNTPFVRNRDTRNDECKLCPADGKTGCMTGSIMAKWIENQNSASRY